jgi:nitroreductase
MILKEIIMETLDAIHKRCSLKTHLSRRKIELEKMNTILEAAQLAPSARNTQPWRFILVQDRKMIEALTPAFSEANRMVRDAAAIIVVCGRARDDVAHDGKEYYLFDIGLAVENMILAATDLGLVTHLMTAFNEAEMKRILHIPDDVRVVVATPLAYPPETIYDEAASERLSRRTRKNLNELVYHDRWSELEPA